MSRPERTYTVEGMTCGHCRKSVIAQVLSVRGVREADVDLDSGLLTVAGEAVDNDAIRRAVHEAGYTLVA